MFGDGFSIDAGIGNQTGHIVGGIGAAAATQVREICLEIRHHVRERGSIEGTPRVRVRTAEQFLGQFHHERLIAFRDAEDRHDHPQRIPDRDILDEVALAAEIGEAIHIFPGQLLDTIRKHEQVGSCEPLLRQRPVATVFGIVHRHQGANEVPPSRELQNDRIQELGAQERARIVDEQCLVAFDRPDIGMAGDGPERFEAVRRHLSNRRVLAQPGELRVHPVLVRPAGWTDDGRVQLRRFGKDLRFHIRHRQAIPLRAPFPRRSHSTQWRGIALGSPDFGNASKVEREARLNDPWHLINQNRGNLHVWIAVP